jgi:hypothetical protein
LSELDTVTLLREMKDRQRQRGRFDFQRVAFDSVMGVGLVLVGWVAVKAGLGLYELSRVVSDPEGAAQDKAREIEVAMVRNQIRVLKGQKGPLDILQTDAARAAKLAKAEGRLGDLLAALDESVKVDEETPGIGMLKAADRMYGKYGPVLPAAVVGGNIFMEVMRIKRERNGKTL